MHNSSGFLTCFMAVGLANFLLRITIFRTSVLFPIKLYLKVKWRFYLYLIKQHYIFPFILTIFQISMMRMLFFAFIDIFSTTNSSSQGTTFAILTLTAYACFMVSAFYLLYVSDSKDSWMQYLFFYELKSDCSYFYFFHLCLDFVVTFYFALFSNNPN